MIEELSHALSFGWCSTSRAHCAGLFRDAADNKEGEDPTRPWLLHRVTASAAGHDLGSIP